MWAELFEILPEVPYSAEDLDWRDKTIVPFCTSGGSGIGETAKRMQEIVGASAVVKEGTRLGGTVSEADLAIWTSELGL